VSPVLGFHVLRLLALHETALSRDELLSLLSIGEAGDLVRPLSALLRSGMVVETVAGLQITPFGERTLARILRSLRLSAL
jgi:hypothetical protein